MGMKKPNKPGRPQARRAVPVSPSFELVPLERLQPDPALPRRAKDQDRDHKLAESLDRLGQLVPITARQVEDHDKLLIITGERRWQAASLTTGVNALHCQVIEDPGEEETLVRRLIEDVAREPFPPVEVGKMIKRLQEIRGVSARRLIAELGVDRYRVYRALRLLRLPPPVQEMVRRGELLPTVAFQITRAPAEDRQAIAEKVVREGLTFHRTVDVVNRRRAAAGNPSQPRCRFRPGWVPLFRSSGGQLTGCGVGHSPTTRQA
jgi:ParB family chromosome partitioning protein